MAIISLYGWRCNQKITDYAKISFWFGSVRHQRITVTKYCRFAQRNNKEYQFYATMPSKFGLWLDAGQLSGALGSVFGTTLVDYTFLQNHHSHHPLDIFPSSEWIRRTSVLFHADGWYPSSKIFLLSFPLNIPYIRSDLQGTFFPKCQLFGFSLKLPL